MASEQIGSLASKSSEEIPTQGRKIVLLFLCSLAGIMYLDRICMAQAIKSIQQEFQLTNTHASYIAMAFTLSYGIFEIPTGRWGDQMGSRAVLTRISIWWSAFTALTGACWGFWSLLIVRFLFGAGEAGCYPNTARVLSKWFPVQEAGRAQGWVLTSAQIGAVLSPIVAAYLISQVGWRGSFVIFGAIGVVWAGIFWWWFRDDPAAHPAVNAAELMLIRQQLQHPHQGHGAVPWGLVFKNPSIWILGVIQICASFNSYFYFTWFSKYLMSGRGVPDLEAGGLASMALAGSAVGTFLGGYLANWISNTSQRPDQTRSITCGSCFVLAAGCLWASLQAESPRIMALWATMSCVCAFVTLPNWWSCAIGISGRHVGALFGLMNTMGVIGGMGSQYFFGRFTDWRKAQGYEGRAQWDPAFYVDIGIILFGALLWFVYRSIPVESSTESAESTAKLPDPDPTNNHE